MIAGKPAAILQRDESAVRAHPAVSYFALTFGISWAGAATILAPRWLHGAAAPKFSGLMVFPAMLLGPAVAGIVMTGIVAGRPGVLKLWAGLHKAKIPGRWYLVLLIAPVLIMSVLNLFRAVVSPVFAPNFFLMGASFGVIAGFVEEVGWMGFAFGALSRKRSAFAAALLLGVLWGIWHIPAINYLGTATPHGSYWLGYFFAFTAAMTALRILIAWSYVNTGSLLLTQLLHASSTGSLVVFSPPGVTARQETFCYAAYAVALWMVVGVVWALFGSKLQRSLDSETAGNGLN
jgi:CAAX protease family protein